MADKSWKSIFYDFQRYNKHAIKWTINTIVKIYKKKTNISLIDSTFMYIVSR